MNAHCPKAPSAPPHLARLASLLRAALWLSLAALLTSGASAQTFQGITHTKMGRSTLLIKLVNGQPTLIDLDLAPEQTHPGAFRYTFPYPYVYQGMAGYLSETTDIALETFANHLRVSHWRKTGAHFFTAIVRSTSTETYQDPGTIGKFSTDPDGDNLVATYFLVPSSTTVTPFANQYSCRIVARKFHPPDSKTYPYLSIWDLHLAEPGLQSVDLQLWPTGPRSWGLIIFTDRFVPGNVGILTHRRQSCTLREVGTGS